MLQGDNVRLRAIEHSDLPRFVTWMNDPQVRRGLARCLPMSLAEEEDWFTKMLQTPAEEHVLVIEVQVENVWKSIGGCGFHLIDWRNRSASVGISIGEREAWDHGHGTQAMKLLLAHGFETLNLHRIWLLVYASNPRAIRCYEKVGFVPEGRQREANFREGRYEDVLVMSMLREEWKQHASG
jgi:RimJ/RimL family protein N-acetyltransferase